VAEIQVGQTSRQIYFLVEQISGEFGTGTGEEFTPSNADNPKKGIYIPIRMPIEQIRGQANIYPADVARLVLRSIDEGWREEPLLAYEEPK
jgi:hypothetical protein